MTAAPHKVVVIGGGLSGLTAAYRVQKKARESNQPVQITLLESSDRLGGVIQTIREDGFLMERGPDCFLSAKPAAMELCQELGLEQELIPTLPEFRKSYILKRGRLIPVPEGLYLMAPGSIWPFLQSSLLSWPGKLRVAMETVVPRRKSDEDESLAHFVRRRLGQEALERIAQPMVAGIYTGDPEKLSLSATMPQLAQWEKEHGSVVRALRQRKQAEKPEAESAASGPRYSLFLTLRSGMQTLTDTLTSKLDPKSIRLKTKVRGLFRHGHDWQIEMENAPAIHADEVFLSCAAPISGQLLESVMPETSRVLKSFESSSAVTLNLAYQNEQIRRRFPGIGFVVPHIEKRKVLACTFSHQKFESRAPSGYALLRAFAGGSLRPDVFQLQDQDLIDALLEELEELFQIQGKPQKVLLSRYPNSMPQYNLGHEERLRKIEQALRAFPSLHLIGASYRGVGIPDTIRNTEPW